MTIQNWKRGRYGSISLKSKVSSIAVEDKGSTGVTRNGAHWTLGAGFTCIIRRSWTNWWKVTLERCCQQYFSVIVFALRFTLEMRNPRYWHLNGKIIDNWRIFHCHFYYLRVFILTVFPHIRDRIPISYLSGAPLANVRKAADPGAGHKRWGCWMKWSFQWGTASSPIEFQGILFSEWVFRCGIAALTKSNKHSHRAGSCRCFNLLPPPRNSHLFGTGLLALIGSETAQPLGAPTWPWKMAWWSWRPSRQRHGFQCWLACCQVPTSSYWWCRHP